jgi:hypothetical protein
VLSFEEANFSAYTSLFDPPAGLAFSEALATAYSLDPAFALQIPVHLARAGGGRAGPADELQIFEAARRHSAAISIFVQNGRIRVPASATRDLYGLVERMVVSVQPPGRGVFHPKIWVVRFAAPDGSQVLYRLAVLTRNLTRDRCRDLALRLEGPILGRLRGQGGNAPLAGLLEALPRMAVGPSDPAHADRAWRMAAEIARVRWEPPKGVESVRLFVHGLDGQANWRPPNSDRMVAVSPFCSPGALARLAAWTGEAAALVSRPETLDSLGPEALAGFGRRLVLDEAAERADLYDDEAGPEARAGEAGLDPADLSGRGLHAKFYLFEVGRSDVVLVVGSANATEPALPAAGSGGPRNVEILVELSGKRRILGGVDDLLGPGGLGNHLVDHECLERVPEDPALAEAERIIDEARRLLAGAGLKVKCLRTRSPEVWAMELRGAWPALPGVASVALWPITVPEESAVEAAVPRRAGPIALGEFTASALTGLIAFRIRLGPEAAAEAAASFVLNLPVEGLPRSRDGAIMSRVVGDEAGLMRYIGLLCGDDEIDGDAWEGEETGSAPAVHGQGPAGGADGAAGPEDVPPILEKLTRLYCRNPEKLRGLFGLVEELSEAKRALSPEFLEFWRVFRQAAGD